MFGGCSVFAALFLKWFEHEFESQNHPTFFMQGAVIISFSGCITIGSWYLAVANAGKMISLVSTLVKNSFF